MTTEKAITDTESARAALPEAAFGMAVFEPLEAVKAYVQALNLMSCHPDMEDHFANPMHRLVCDIEDLVDEIEREASKVCLLGRKAVGHLPDLPDDGNGEVKEAAGDAGGDAKLIALGERLKAAWAVEREALARNCSTEEGDAVNLACSEIADQIEKTPATTVEGLKVKASAIMWCCGNEPFAEPYDTTDKRIVMSLLSDLKAMPAAARSTALPAAVWASTMIY